MRITLVLPYLGMTGGTKVMVEYANRLAARGHVVTLVYPWYHTPPRSLLQRLKGPTKGLINLACRNLGWKELRWMPVRVPLRAVSQLRDAAFPDADILIATENATIEPLSDLSAAKGKKVYLIQGYETWTRDPSAVDATWRMEDWHKVVIATRLKRLAEEKFSSPADLVVNGVDLAAFHGRERRRSHPPRVLCLYHPLEIKGTGDAIEVFRMVQAQGIPFRPVFFGVTPPGSNLDVLKDVEYHRRPLGERLRRLYAGADVFLSPSWMEGGPLPPMEAMACRTAVITTNVGAVPDYAIPGQTAIVVEPRNLPEMADAMVDLLTNPRKREAIAAAGHRHIQRFSWDHATDRLERILCRLVRGAPLR